MYTYTALTPLLMVLLTIAPSSEPRATSSLSCSPNEMTFSFRSFAMCREKALFPTPAGPRSATTTKLRLCWFRFIFAGGLAIEKSSGAGLVKLYTISWCGGGRWSFLNSLADCQITHNDIRERSTSRSTSKHLQQSQNTVSNRTT